MPHDNNQNTKMEPIKVIFKFKDKTQWTEITLMRALSKIGHLNCIGIFIGNVQATLHLSNPMQITPFYENPNALTQIKLELIDTPEVKATRTIYAPRMPSFIANMDKNLLISLIQDSNSELKPEAIYFVGSYSSPTSLKNNMKVVFENANMAKTVLQEGLLIDSFEIQSTNIYPETIIRPPQCNNCYKLDHKTRECHLNKQACSRCTGLHAYTECDKNKPPICANCGGPHSAFYASCPEIKKMVNIIRKQKKNPNFDQNGGNQSQGASGYNNSNNNTPTPSQPAPPPTTNAWFPNLPNTNSRQQQTSNNRIPPQSATSTPSSQGAFNSPPPPTNPPQSPPPPPNFKPSPSSNPVNLEAISLQYDAYKTFAKEVAADNQIQYLKLMNIFFKQAGLSFQIDINQELIDVINSKETASAESQTDEQITTTKANMATQTLQESIDSESEDETINSPPLSPLSQTSNLNSQPASTPKNQPRATNKSPPPTILSPNCSSIEEEAEELSSSDNSAELSDINVEDLENSVNNTIISNTSIQSDKLIINENGETKSPPSLSPTSSSSSARSAKSNEITDSQDTFGVTPAQHPPRITRSSSNENIYSVQLSVKPKQITQGLKTKKSFKTRKINKP